MKAIHIVLTAAGLALAGSGLAAGDQSSSSTGATGSTGATTGGATTGGTAGSTTGSTGATGSMGTMSQAEFKTYDKDSDGKLSSQEIESVPQEQRASLLAMDSNGDGEVSEQEANAGKG